MLAFMLSRIRRAALPILVAIPILACGLSGAITQAAFVTPCKAQCTAEGADPAICESYCQCSYEYARDNGRLKELENVDVVPGQQMAPVLVDLLAECGSDLWDSNFQRLCVESCRDGAVCQARCECFLRELRGTGPREASTRFLVENLDVAPPTEAGNRRLEAAEQVCLR